MIWHRLRTCLVVFFLGAFLAVSMAEAMIMPQASVSGMSAGMVNCNDMDMPANEPMPCDDASKLCLGAFGCVSLVNIVPPAPMNVAVQQWTRTSYRASNALFLEGRIIAPALEPPIAA